MRNFINIITEAMSRHEAESIFSKNGVSTAGMSAVELKTARNNLAKKIHPDLGGDSERLKMVNAAYDVLKPNVAAMADKASRNAYRAAQADREADEYRKRKYAKADAKEHSKNFRDINFCKNYLNDLATNSGKPSKKYTVWNYDGNFFRGTFTVMGNSTTFSKMAETMKKWDSTYRSVAVFISSEKSLWLIHLYGVDVSPPIAIEHDSFNNNPSNDQSFMRKLPDILDDISSKM
jgi:curved DNA-binding protein CbpA